MPISRRPEGPPESSPVGVTIILRLSIVFFAPQQLAFFIHVVPRRPDAYLSFRRPASAVCRIFPALSLNLAARGFLARYCHVHNLLCKEERCEADNQS
jgi:hypothetical protein